MVYDLWLSTFDNGWSSEIAVKNIKKVTNALDIDLETLRY